MFHVSLPCKSCLREFISKSIFNFDQNHIGFSHKSTNCIPNMDASTTVSTEKASIFLPRQVIKPNAEYIHCEPSHHLEAFVKSFRNITAHPMRL